MVVGGVIIHSVRRVYLEQSSFQKVIFEGAPSDAVDKKSSGWEILAWRLAGSHGDCLPCFVFRNLGYWLLNHLAWCWHLCDLPGWVLALPSLCHPGPPLPTLITDSDSCLISRFWWQPAYLFFLPSPNSLTKHITQEEVSESFPYFDGKVSIPFTFQWPQESV